MAAQLTIHKRLLTLFTNKLEHIVGNIRKEKLDHPCSNIGQEERAEEATQLEESISAIESISGKVEKALSDLATAIDNQGNADGGDPSEFEGYIGKAEEALSKAFDQVILLRARLRALSETTQHTDPSIPRGPADEMTEPATISMAHARTKAMELPPLPIPVFTGNLWEWDNFWEMFNHNIHSRDLPDMVKYNYLLDALKGEARECVMKFRVSKDNYPKAIACLLNKYNNRERLVNQLVERLENCVLRSSSIRDQRSLLEEIQAITTQLEEKGEDVNSSWLIKKVLAKFPDPTKRKVITKRQGQVDTSFTMATLFKLADEILSTEEMVLQFVDKNPQKPIKSNLQGKRRPYRAITAKCMYCKGDHSSKTCTVYATPQDRSSYLRQNNLCLICAASDHTAPQCRGRPCFSCGGPHHTSCCFKSEQRISTLFKQDRSPAKGKDKQGDASKVKENSKGETNKGSPRKIRSNTVIAQDGEGNTSQEAPLLSAQSVMNAKSPLHPCLPTGEVTLLEPKTRNLIKVHVLFDTGAEVSFIDSKLAATLRLPVLEEKHIRLNTFGTKEVLKRKCQKVQVEAWDQDGNPHSLELLTHNILTHSYAHPHLSPQDQEFLSTLNIPVNPKQGKQVIQPSILLGCDLLWSFVRNDTPPISLPSGLHILPTKLGYLICGKQKESRKEVLHVSQYQDSELDQWEQYWSMNSVRMYMVRGSEEEITQEERDQWEQYWSMDAAGTEEFQGPEKEAQSKLDKQVWEQFNRTIERRKDGYYVHLPWKVQHPPLPDNRMLAYKRLVNVWTSLKKDRQLLDQYNDVFQDQLSKGIVEPVEGDNTGEGVQVHYIPHQPVLTPQKATTKLRIVFDASAHYKGCPSLNDVLHRGPVILPSLYGLLLRLRIGRIALISDVEKAFLQVRLHERDRDATRFIWLKDHKEPPSRNNIRTLRFTRVTFGLKPSPFLLAGTTHYHLDRHQEERLAQVIKANLYVDNLLLTSDSCQEAQLFYSKAKAIFSELRMNLREFVTNDGTVMSSIPDVDKANSHRSKVLGILWDSRTDILELRCTIKEFPVASKRTVTSVIATVYDPMGWFVPLLHRAKVFLQNLWREQYEWDTPLSEEKEEQWRKITEDLKGFNKSIPRYLTPKMTNANIVIFADAINTGMTACAYLQNSEGVHLLIAKSKLAPIRKTITIPKLEMNAITLAARVAIAVVRELKTVLNIGCVYILSDSEIALCWVKGTPGREMGIFIGNRLAEVKRIVDHLISEQCSVRFGHVSTEDNPADCGTRGLSKEEFSQHFWWTGPTWLQNDVSCWPIRETIFGYPIDEHGDEPNDKAEVMVATEATSYDPELLKLTQVRTLTKAKRIIAYALRFIRSTVRETNKKRAMKIQTAIPDVPSAPNPSFLSGPEMELSGKVIIKAHQALHVTSSIVKTLKDLNIRSDQEGILRCYGRLGRAQLKFGAKYPAFVSQKTILAKIIIWDVHQDGHTGINHTVSLVRQHFWIPQLRSQVQNLIRRCVKCQKLNNLSYKYPLQEDLPKERVVISRPFQHVGLDYFGPLSIRREDGSQGKCYGAIITCTVTRLLHLDLVSDMTTVAFLHMLKRFFARRGVPQTIICDNAPTFLLGEEILTESIQAAQCDPSINKELSNRGIHWRHITPYAPWQGGFYERMIKSIKHSLYKTLGRSILSFEELTTTIIEIESILNTRPLTYETTDLDRSRVIRPIDFLQKDICLTHPILPTVREQDTDYYPPDRALAIQTKSQATAALETLSRITDKFWDIWQAQYLTSLREKHVLKIGQKRGCTLSPQEGTAVLIVEATAPRQSWKMGIIQELVANTRGVVREAVVRLPSRRLIRRPINLLVPLELDDETHQEQETKTKMDRANTSSDSTTDSVSVDEERGTPQIRYNLRQRKPINYKDNNSSQFGHFFLLSIAWPSVVLLLLGCMTIAVRAQEKPFKSSLEPTVHDFQGRVTLESKDRIPEEVYGHQSYAIFNAQSAAGNVTFLPDVVVAYSVQWKVALNQAIATSETTCWTAQFGKAMKCRLCIINVLNLTVSILGLMIVPQITYLVLSTWGLGRLSPGCC